MGEPCEPAHKRRSGVAVNGVANAGVREPVHEGGAADGRGEGEDAGTLVLRTTSRPRHRGAGAHSDD